LPFVRRSKIRSGRADKSTRVHAMGLGVVFPTFLQIRVERVLKGSLSFGLHCWTCSIFGIYSEWCVGPKVFPKPQILGTRIANIDVANMLEDALFGECSKGERSALMSCFVRFGGLNRIDWAA
jgi:hypothetical protein